MNHRNSILQFAVVASLAMMTVGCQTDANSHWHFPGQRRTHTCQSQHCQPQYAEAQPDYSFDQSIPPAPRDNNAIHPGHSTDSPEPYAPVPYAEPMYPAPPTPAPMPQVDEFPLQQNPDIPESQAPAPLIEEEVRLKNGSVPHQEDLIRGVGEPDRLSPFSVRSIYEKLRPRTTQPENIENGPIASRRRQEPTTRVVDFRNVNDGPEVTQPVILGLPETDEEDLRNEYTPAVMQATPSSYRHPLFADPTGHPYGVSN